MLVAALSMIGSYAVFSRARLVGNRRSGLLRLGGVVFGIGHFVGRNLR